MLIGEGHEFVRCQGIPLLGKLNAEHRASIIYHETAALLEGFDPKPPSTGSALPSKTFWYFVVTEANLVIVSLKKKKNDGRGTVVIPLLQILDVEYAVLGSEEVCWVSPASKDKIVHDTEHFVTNKNGIPIPGTAITLTIKVSSCESKNWKQSRNRHSQTKFSERSKYWRLDCSFPEQQTTRLSILTIEGQSLLHFYIANASIEAHMKNALGANLGRCPIDHVKFPKVTKNCEAWDDALHAQKIIAILEQDITESEGILARDCKLKEFLRVVEKACFSSIRSIQQEFFASTRIAKTLAKDLLLFWSVFETCNEALASARILDDRNTRGDSHVKIDQQASPPGIVHHCLRLLKTSNLLHIRDELKLLGALQPAQEKSVLDSTVVGDCLKQHPPKSTELRWRCTHSCGELVHLDTVPLGEPSHFVDDEDHIISREDPPEE